MRQESPYRRNQVRSRAAARARIARLALVLLGIAGASANVASAEAGRILSTRTDEAVAGKSSPIVLDEILDMVCFPPTAMISPPCPVPVGIDPDLVAPNPAGQLRLVVFDDDTSLVSIKLSGMSPEQVATAWFVHFPPNQPPPHPIFAPIGPGQPPVAFADTPLAHTAARFSEGLSDEPNQFRILPNGRAYLTTLLDYNPLKPGQVPLVNGMVLANQGAAPPGSVAEQPECCPDFPAGPQREPIGGSYLRHFDPVTGFQIKGPDGRPELVRSPTRPVVVAVFIHIDGTTSGIVPGVPTPPFLVAPPFTTGSFYLLGLFFLVPLG